MDENFLPAAKKSTPSPTAYWTQTLKQGRGHVLLFCCKTQRGTEVWLVKPSSVALIRPAYLPFAHSGCSHSFLWPLKPPVLVFFFDRTRTKTAQETFEMTTETIAHRHLRISALTKTVFRKWRAPVSDTYVVCSKGIRFGLVACLRTFGVV